MVMGDDSCAKGRGFKSRHCILDGQFFTLICCKNCIVCLKGLKINEREAGVGPFKKQYQLSVNISGKKVITFYSSQNQFECRFKRVDDNMNCNRSYSL